MSFSIKYDREWLDKGCNKLIIRCYNKVNLFSNRDVTLRDCEMDKYGIVIDAKPPLALPDNPTWKLPDIDYLNSRHDLAAVWPGLLHGYFLWAVLELPLGAKRLEEPPLDLRNHPYTIKSGVTNKNFVNVKGLDLINGRKYLICLYANVTLKHHEEFKENLTEIRACSNGVVIDNTPPTSGTLRMPQLINQYQTSVSDIYLEWDKFIDIEETDSSRGHVEGIHFYEYRIGTIMDQGDIREYSSLGLTTKAVVTDLILKPGLTYFATIRATDYVGLTAESNSVMFIVETSGPKLTAAPIIINNGFFDNREIAKICWTDVFQVVTSPISEIYFSIGSKAGRKNIFPFTLSNKQCEELNSTILSRLEEGKRYYVNVKAINKAGLETTASSPAILVDYTPPMKGHVFDIDPHTSSLADVGYRTSLDSLDAYWSGFHDPHSSIMTYSYWVGLCEYCDNIIAKTDVGIVDRISIKAIRLYTGKRYYVTIEACNHVGLCSEVSSNGVVFDDTPPIIGKVKDGTRKEDMDYTHMKNYISAMWYGFFDSESKIMRYDWWAGTSPEVDDILPVQRLHNTEVNYANLDTDMPTNTKIFVTVRAYNYAGLHSEATSDGFIVDDSPPQILTALYHDTTVGSIVANTSILTDYLRIKWLYENPDRILEHLVSVEAHSNGMSVVHPIKIGALFSEWTFTELQLKDGSEYRVVLKSCSLANICIQQNTSVLIDSSPPTVGTVAVDTEHAAQPNRSVEKDWMIWSEHFIHFAWLGFIDPHSGIREYGIKVGRSILSSELLPNDEAFKIDHDPTAPDFAHEGPIQNARLSLTESLSPWDEIFITLWAVNKVGLKSYPLTFSFKAAKGGTLILSRRCEAQTCYGHCVCSPVHQLCTPRLNNCEKLESRYNSNWWIEVKDIVDFTSDDPQDEYYIPTRTLLAAKWKVTRKLGEPIMKYECSVGYFQTNESANGLPSGIFPPRDHRLWFDTVDNDQCIIHISNPEWLHADIQYQFFVRVWYNQNQYFIFNSTGFQIHTKPPSIEKRLGVMVKEVETNASKQDIDFIANNNTLNIYWNKLFHFNAKVFKFYHLFLGSYQGGGDIKREIISFINETRFTFVDLDLSEHQKYFTTVIGCDKIGLCQQQTSDGFVVDTSPPSEGRVLHGTGLTQSEFQESNRIVSAHWFGFVDRESFIKSYSWCVGSSDTDDHCDIIPLQNMKIRTFVKDFSLPATVSSGTILYHKVSAENQAGWKTRTVSSEGMIVDYTPPMWTSELSLGPEELLNPSFEVTTEEENKVPEWIVDQGSYVSFVINSNASQAFDGSIFLELAGSMRQTLFTHAGRKYRVVLHTTHIFDSKEVHNTLNVKVTLNNRKWLFPMARNDYKIYRDEYRPEFEQKWHKHVLYFEAETSETDFVISSIGYFLKIGVDGLSVKELLQSNITHSYSNPIKVEIVTDRSLDAVHANWAAEDPESSIREYLWAIGTIPGGTQIQEFQRSGQQSSVTASDVNLQHNVTLYVTVVAINGAGLRISHTSNGCVIDRTPPKFLFVRNGGNENEDALHSSPHEDLVFQFDAVDPESGIDYCEWCLGRVSSACDLYPFTKLPKNTFFHSYRLENQTELAGVKIFTTVKCTNHGGLKSHRTSSGLILTDSLPKSNEASLEIINPSPSCYSRKFNSLIPDRNEEIFSNKISLMMKWEGFQDDIKILHYEMNIFDSYNKSMIPDGSWELIPGENSLSYDFYLPNTPSEVQKYYCHIRAVNWMNMRSLSVVKSFTIDNRLPNILDATAIYQSNSVLITWLTSPDSLHYEISIGSSRGNADILREVALKESKFQISQISRNQIYYIVITAISNSGLYTTECFKLKYNTNLKEFELSKLNVK